MLDFIRLVKAAQSVAISNDYEFIGFDDISALEQSPEVIEIWAKVKLTYEGTLPESYKTLNLLIGDWVEDNLQRLTKTLHTELKEHFEENYPDHDTSELEQIEDTAIWTDQLDYMPIIDESSKSMIIEIELVLEAESNDA